MVQIIDNGLSFDDVLLVPQYSKVDSRSSVDTSVIFYKNNEKFKYSHPLIPANMKTVSGIELALEVAKSGGLAILHRFEDYDVIKTEWLNQAMPYIKNIAFSVGVQEKDYHFVNDLCDNGARIICVDVAHGHSQISIDMIEYIANRHPDVLLIAGNVATKEGAIALWEAGADVVKVNVGAGSLCSTRIETGNGVPQLSALIYAHEAREEFIKKYPNRKVYIIADGGMKCAGDVVKSLCFSDMAMSGSFFSGCQEAPGEIVQMNGISYKKYAGSSTHKNKHIEGVTALVPLKGRINDIINKILEGVRSGCSYQGVDNLTDLRDNPVFIKMTVAGYNESVPHNPFTIKE
jgi:IMP dehydrogenase